MLHVNVNFTVLAIVLALEHPLSLTEHVEAAVNAACLDEVWATNLDTYGRTEKRCSADAVKRLGTNIWTVGKLAKRGLEHAKGGLEIVLEAQDVR